MSRTINLKTEVQENLRMRYRPDSILPFDDNKIVIDYMTNPQNFSIEDISRFNIMNPNLAKFESRLYIKAPRYLGKYPKHFNNKLLWKILRDLDIVPTRDDLKVIKDSQYRILSIGMGGAMINFFYNLQYWCMKLEVPGIFHRMHVREADFLEYTNVPRIGEDIAFETSASTVTDIDDEIGGILKVVLTKNLKWLVENISPLQKSEYVDQKAIDLFTQHGYNMIGAPDFETRKLLEDKNFIFFGHGGTSVDLTYQPVVNDELGNETYGSIDIPVLLLNFQVATAAWIKKEANRIRTGESYEHDSDIFTFDMAEYLEANPDAVELSTQDEWDFLG